MPEAQPIITNEAFLTLKHPLQGRRFALALFFSLILFPLIAAALALGTVVLVVPIFALLFWLSGRVLYAHFLGNSILVSEMNYPRVNNIGEELKTLMDYHKPVAIFVHEQGNFNAALFKFFFYRRAVFLNSELLEQGVTDDELRWLIGRFIGYLRARRQAGFWGWSIRAAEHLVIFNIFLLPYHRALVYTGDRIALAVISGEINTAVAAMQKLMVGRLLGYSVNPNGIVDQHRQVKGSFFAFLARLSSRFPHTTARYVDLVEFARERYPVQYARFEAENPGLPADIKKLSAMPSATGTGPGRGDPVWGSLAAAVIFLALSTLVSWKVVVPRIKAAQAAQSAAASTSPITPADSGTSDTTSATTPTPAASTAADPGVAAPQLQSFTSADGHFSAMFPGTPTQGTQPVNMPNGDTMTIYQTAVNTNDVSYMVMYNDYPDQYVGADPQTILQNARDGGVSASKGMLLTDQAVSLSGVPGRAYTFSDPTGKVVTAHDFLDGHRLYQVVVVSAKDATASDAQNFLNSFQITQ